MTLFHLTTLHRTTAAIVLLAVGFLLKAPLPAQAPTKARDEIKLARGSVNAGSPADDSIQPFTTEDGATILVTGDEYSLGQLRDPLLAGRTWELEIEPRENGPMEIRRLFTIKDGKRNVVRYYCEICHIYTHKPGRCMCCQGDTTLHETPEDEL